MIAGRRSKSPRQAVDQPQFPQPKADLVPPSPVWLTVAQIAQRLQISSDTVRGWVASGELPATDVTAPGPRQRRHVRITEANLQEFLQRRQFQPLRPAAAPARANRMTTSGGGQPPIKDYFSDAPVSPTLN
jgi:excisionase family DNA binding protein